MGNCKLLCLDLGQGTEGGACEQQQGEEQNSPGEGSGARFPLPSLLDLDGWMPARARPSLHPMEGAGPANYSFSAWKGSLLLIELGRFLCFLIWAGLPLYLFTISRAAGSHWH